MINHSNENVLMDDANSPEVNKKLLGLISQDFVKVADQLKEASYQIRKRGFSEYPVFVMGRDEAEIGLMLIAREEQGNKWNYRASYLQEFVDRNLVGEESVELFKENYKKPDEYCCLFVIEGEFAGFVFVPFPED
jgi:phage pi2 protein 07